MKWQTNLMNGNYKKLKNNSLRVQGFIIFLHSCDRTVIRIHNSPPSSVVLSCPHFLGDPTDHASVGECHYNTLGISVFVINKSW